MLVSALKKVAEKQKNQVGTRPVSQSLGQTNYIHKQDGKTKVTAIDGGQPKAVEDSATLLSAAFIPAGAVDKALSGTKTGTKTRDLSNTMRDITGYKHVAGHMINNNLGGLGNTAPMVNLIPFTHVDNMKHLSIVEQKAKTANQTHDIAFGTNVLEHANVELSKLGQPLGAMEHIPNKIESGYIATDASGQAVEQHVKELPVNFAQTENTNSDKQMNYSHFSGKKWSLSDDSATTQAATQQVKDAISATMSAYMDATSQQELQAIHMQVLVQLRAYFPEKIVEQITTQALTQLYAI